MPKIPDAYHTLVVKRYLLAQYSNYSNVTFPVTIAVNLSYNILTSFKESNLILIDFESPIF